MAKIMVFNPSTNRMEVYYRGLTERMPYANNLTVREFRGSSKSDIIWTDRRLMNAWNTLRREYGKPIMVGFAFKRIGEGGHSNMSQHYAGMAMDMGQNLSSAERDRLRNLAIRLGIFSYVEPKVLTPTWVHVDTRVGTPACARGGFPLVRSGSRGVYVAVLQDALNTLGYNAGTIDGVFGPQTRDAVMRFQRANGLVVDGIVGCNTWEKLTSRANGANR
jgi:hypothetical protein